MSFLIKQPHEVPILIDYRRISKAESDFKLDQHSFCPFLKLPISPMKEAKLLAILASKSNSQPHAFSRFLYFRTLSEHSNDIGAGIAPSSWN